MTMPTEGMAKGITSEKGILYYFAMQLTLSYATRLSKQENIND